jgi:hypothetical protein
MEDVMRIGKSIHFVFAVIAVSLFLLSSTSSPLIAQCNTCGGYGQHDLKNLYDFDMKLDFPGQNGGPTIVWPGAGQNSNATAGPQVIGFVNGSAPAPVFLGNGASHIEAIDFYLPLNGIDWYHNRHQEFLETIQNGLIYHHSPEAGNGY